MSALVDMLQILMSAVLLFSLAMSSAAAGNCAEGQEVCFDEADHELPIAQTEPVSQVPEPVVTESVVNPQNVPTDNPSDSAPTLQQPDAEGITAEQQLLIDGITADLNARRLMRPQGNNALNKVRRLKQIMPAHDYAINGERYIARVYMVLGRRAMKNKDIALAEKRLNSALKLDKKVPGKQALIEQILAAQKASVVTAEKAPTEENPRYRDTENNLASATQAAAGGFVAPVMVAIPAGKFVMGSEAGAEDEKPMHEVTIEAFSMSKFEITLEQYRVYAVENLMPAPQYLPEDSTRPVTNVSWEDARDYARWLSVRTGKSYRLATEAEWEYAARAGTVTPYYTGEDLLNGGNCDGCGSVWDAKQSAPVGSFPPNEFGLYDMHGNVWEWVQDCWTDNYFGRGDNSAAIVLTGCERHVLRGGSWANTADYARASYRGNQSPVYRHESIGFRVVHDGL